MGTLSNMDSGNFNYIASPAYRHIWRLKEIKKRAVKQSSFYIIYICIYKPNRQFEFVVALSSKRPSHYKALYKTNADTLI